MATLLRNGQRALGSIAPRRMRRRRAQASRSAGIETLKALAASGKPIVAGPWIGGIGAELLYWIPLLNWLTTVGGVDPKRIVAVSRGGADSWYSEIAGAYVDLRDHPDLRVGKRHGFDDLTEPEPLESRRADRAAFALARQAAGGDADWLHPSLLHALFGPRWRDGGGAGVVTSHTLHRPLPTEPWEPAELERPYVAVKAYFHPYFPETEENRSLVGRLIEDLAARARVVLLPTTVEDNSTGSFTPADDSPADFVEAPPARHALGLQSAVVRDAELLVAPYGGISFLGPYVGTPSIAYYSRGGFAAAHLDAIDRVGRLLGPRRSRLFRARHVGHLALGSAREDEAQRGLVLDADHYP